MLHKVQKNRPIATVLKEYLDKEKGKITAARKELQRRFDGLDWDVQKKAIIAHLISTRTDRMWIYTRILDLWDDDFLPYVTDVWETYHEERCSWIVVRYFPKEYVMANLDKFTFERNYYFLCLRFGTDADFVVDKDLMSRMDYLKVCLKLKKKILDDEALGIFFEIVIDAILNYWREDFNKKELGLESRVKTFTPLLVGNVNMAYYYIEKLNVKSVINWFPKWCREIEDAVENYSEEWKQQQAMSLDDYYWNLRAYCILLKYMALHLPVFNIDRLTVYNPNLQILIDELMQRTNFDEIIKGVGNKGYFNIWYPSGKVENMPLFDGLPF